MINQTKTIYSVEHLFVVNEKEYVIKLTITDDIISNRKYPRRIKLTYFEGNSDTETYNWFQHIEDYVTFLEKKKIII